MSMPQFFSAAGLDFANFASWLAFLRKRDIESGEERPWVLKDLRKTCATYYDEHVPESSVEILGHSARGITYRHYAHRAVLWHFGRS